MLRFFVAGWLASQLVLAAAPAADFEDLLGKLPGPANALLVIDVESLWLSPLAQTENWQQRMEAAFDATPLLVPPGTRRFVMAAEYDIEFMRPLWEAAVLHLPEAPGMQQVAVQREGTFDRLAGMDAVWLARSLLVALDRDTLGLLIPARRQAAVRWLDEVARADSPRLSPFLRTAAERVSSGEAQVAMALELHQVVRPEEVEKKVRQSSLVRPERVAAVTEVLTSLRGITLTIQVDQRSRGSLLIDFDRSAQPLAEIAKPLVLSALATAGAQLEDFLDWQASTQGMQVRLTGELSPSGRKRILSLLALDHDFGLSGEASSTRTERAPPPPQPDLADRDPPQTAPAADRGERRNSAMVEASRRYFRTVNGYLEDLRSPRNNQQLNQVALWMENYARRIERMPTRRLDPDVAAYGQLVAQSLHQIVGLIHGVYRNIEYRTAQSGTGIQINVAAIPTWNTVGVGGVGYFREYAPFAAANIDLGAMMAERRQITDQELAAAQSSAYELLQRIDEEAARLRSELSARHGVEF